MMNRGMQVGAVPSDLETPKGLEHSEKALAILLSALRDFYIY